MNRFVTCLLGPEVVMTLILSGVSLFCARHSSGEGGDLRTLEQLVWILPPLAIVPVYLTVFVPGSMNWWWAGRAALASMIGICLLTHRMVDGFGTGAKGQDAGYVLALAFGAIAISVGTAVAGAMIKASGNPEFAGWFRMRPIVGSCLTLLSAVPIGVVLFVVITVVGGLVMGFWSAFRR